MNKDQIKGRVDQAAGKVKEVAGRAVGNEKLEGEGLADQASGKVQSSLGDARQGVHVAVRGTSAGTPTTLTLDVAVVRVGTDAVVVTGGGLDGGETDSVRQAARQGTERLQTVLAGRTPSPHPPTD